MHSSNIGVLVNVKVYEFISFVRNVVFFKSFVHIEGSSKTLPGVRSSMFIELHVTVEDFVQSLFAANFNHIIVFGDHVDDAQLACLLCELPDAKSGVLPPWLLKAAGVP